MESTLTNLGYIKSCCRLRMITMFNKHEKIV